MKKFQFICKTDLLAGGTFYFTREDGVYVNNSMHLDRDKAYAIFQKLVRQEPVEIYEILETQTSPTE